MSNDTAHSTISCKYCGEELNIIGSTADDWDDDQELLDQFQDAHVDCDKSLEHRAWTELVEAGQAAVQVRHNGDLTTLTDVPRPSWADPSADAIGSYADRYAYRGTFAKIPLSLLRGHVEDGERCAPWIGVRPRLRVGDRSSSVGVWIKEVNADHDGVDEFDFVLTIPEALQLAQTLVAATDLAVTE